MITERDARDCAADTIVDWLNYVDLADDTSVRFRPITTTHEEQTTTVSFLVESADAFRTAIAEGTITIQASIRSVEQ